MNNRLVDHLISYVIILATVFVLILFPGIGTISGQEFILNTNENLILFESREPNLPLLFLIFIISLGWLIWILTHRTKKRRSFTTQTRRHVLRIQNFKCGICKRNVGVWDYHHKDGNRANNNTSNCQALCPTCHAKRSRCLVEVKAKSRGKDVGLGVGLGLLFIMILYSFI
jgi:hypothetical protein